MITTFWGYDATFQNGLAQRFPEFWNRQLAKANFALDHFTFDAGYSPELTINQTRYWVLLFSHNRIGVWKGRTRNISSSSFLFSHNRIGVWKGMIRLELNTPADDEAARQEVAKHAP